MQKPHFSQEKFRRLPYALSSSAILLTQYMAIVVAFRILGEPLELDLPFFVVPLRSIVLLGAHDIVMLFTFALMLAAAWAQVALASRRAADANVSSLLVASVILPGIQNFAILVLCLLPSRFTDLRPSGGGSIGQKAPDWLAIGHGLLAGVTLTLAAVGVATLVFGAYGYGLFVATPFMIGACAAYVGNRQRDMGHAATARLVVGAIALGGAGLIAAALEGIICILLSAPLTVGVAVVGGLFGRAVARRSEGRVIHSLTAAILLPVVFATENLLPLSTAIQTEQEVVIASPADIVWSSLLRMDLSDSKPSLLFRLGIAFPVRAHIDSEGVGAVRQGEFSTGISEERVTEWVVGRKLGFVVLNDPPAMHELSPYEHVHAPHVTGYFRTTYTSFELIPVAPGQTRLVERTYHELRLEPVLYWLPMTRWVINANNARVLDHVRRQSEAASAALDRSLPTRDVSREAEGRLRPTATTGASVAPIAIAVGSVSGIGAGARP